MVLFGHQTRLGKIFVVQIRKNLCENKQNVTTTQTWWVVGQRNSQKTLYLGFNDNNGNKHLTWKTTFCFRQGQLLPKGFVPSSFGLLFENGVHSLVISLAGELGVAGTTSSWLIELEANVCCCCCCLNKMSSRMASCFTFSWAAAAAIKMLGPPTTDPGVATLRTGGLVRLRGLDIRISFSSTLPV